MLPLQVHSPRYRQKMFTTSFNYSDTSSDDVAAFKQHLISSQVAPVKLEAADCVDRLRRKRHKCPKVGQLSPSVMALHRIELSCELFVPTCLSVTPNGSQRSLYTVMLCACSARLRAVMSARWSTTSPATVRTRRAPSSASSVTSTVRAVSSWPSISKCTASSIR